MIDPLPTSDCIGLFSLGPESFSTWWLMGISEMVWKKIGGFTVWLFNIAMENGPFIDGLPIKNGDFPWLC